MDINELVEHFAAQYLGRNQEDRDVPWMDYMRFKNDPGLPKKKMEGKGETLTDMVENSTVKEDRDKSDFGPSLMDGVIDPLSKKNQQDSQPSNDNNDLRYDQGSNLLPASFNQVDTKDDSSLAQLRRYRYRDDNVTGTPWDLSGEGPEAYRTKLAFKTLNEVITLGDHPTSEDIKAKGKALIPVDMSSEEDRKRGLYTIKVPGKEQEDYTVMLQFLKAENKKSLIDHPVQLSCSCPIFLYGGPQYYALLNNYFYMPEFRGQRLAPRPKEDGGKGRGMTFCKHVYSVASHMAELGFDKDYEDALRGQLLEVNEKNPLTDEEFDSVYHLERRTKFVQFLEDKSLSGELHKKVREDLKARGLSEHQVFDFVQGSLSEDSPEEQKDYLLEVSQDNPSLAIFLLLEYREAFGKIPGYLVDTVYKAVKP